MDFLVTLVSQAFPVHLPDRVTLGFLVTRVSLDIQVSVASPATVDLAELADTQVTRAFPAHLVIQVTAVKVAIRVSQE